MDGEPASAGRPSGSGGKGDVRKMRLRVGKGEGEMNVKVRTDESERGLDRESGRGTLRNHLYPVPGNSWIEKKRG